MRAAELIAEELGVEPEIDVKPSLRGEVTHYVADIRKARELLGWQPQTPLDAGHPEGGGVVPRVARRASGGGPRRSCPSALPGEHRARLQEPPTES